MNDKNEPLEDDVQTEDVLDETFLKSGMQTDPVSIAENISTARDSPKYTMPNKKTKSNKVN